MGSSDYSRTSLKQQLAVGRSVCVRLYVPIERLEGAPPDLWVVESVEPLGRIYKGEGAVIRMGFTPRQQANRVDEGTPSYEGGWRADLLSTGGTV